MKKTVNQVMKEVTVFKNEKYPVIFQEIGGDDFIVRYGVVTASITLEEQTPTFYVRFIERVNNIMSIRISENSDRYDIIFTAGCEFSEACKKISLIGVPLGNLREAIEAELSWN